MASEQPAHAPHLDWAVSIVAIRDDPEDAQFQNVVNLASVFSGPHIEYVEAQAELYAKHRFPPRQGWHDHAVNAIPLKRGVRDDLLERSPYTP
jgi:hypothetical protein